MSTTVTINPSADGVGVIPFAAAGVSAVGALLSAVLTDDADCRKMLEQARVEQRTQRFASIRLRTCDLSRLAQSAREAQFSIREGKDWLRIDVPGQRDSVWATRTPAGIAIVGGSESVGRVSMANSVSRVTQTLTSKGLSVSRMPSRPGRRDAEFVATAPGNRRLEIAIAPSGEAVVDAVNHRGPECEQIAQDLAASMEGTVTAYCRKPEFFGGGGVLAWSKQRA